MHRIESVSTRYREERDVKAEHGKPRQSKASLAMSCLALLGESLLSIERIRQGHGNPRQSKYIERRERERERERDSFSTQGGEMSLFSIEAMQTPSFSIQNRECIYSA